MDYAELVFLAAASMTKSIIIIFLISIFFDYVRKMLFVER